MTENCIQGNVESISESGDLVTDIHVEKCADAPDLAEVRVIAGPHETIGIHPVNHSEPDGTLIAIQLDSGQIQIGITGMNISEMLGLGIGEKVQVQW